MKFTFPFWIKYILCHKVRGNRENDVIEEPKMLLLCPNCGAQYEVPEDHIPKKYGRDVQCSACNHTWFQTHPVQDLNPPQQNEFGNPDPLTESEDQSLSASADGESNDPDGYSAGAEPQSAPSRQKRSLHPSVAGVLREEAKREVEERSNSSVRVPGTQNQPELTNNAAQSASSDHARDADMDMRALDALYQNSDQTAKSARGALLPDIDEINSTLSTDVADWPTDSEASKATIEKGQRKLGFFLGIGIIVAAAALYYFANALGESIPILQQPLELYQQWINSMRIALDQWIRQAIDWLQTQWTTIQPPPQ